MRLVSEPKDKKFEQNIALLAACSQIQRIFLTAKVNERDNYVDYLKSTDAEEFVNDFLLPKIKHLYEKGMPDIPEIQNHKDLLKFLPDEDMVPPRYTEQYQRHREMFYTEKYLSTSSKQQQEYQELQSLIAKVQKAIASGEHYDETEISSFLTDDSHTKAFRKFGTLMLTENPAVINRRHAHLAKSIAKKNHLYTDAFRKNLSSTLKEPKIGLHRESRGRFYGNIKKLLIPAAFIVGIGFGRYLPNKSTEQIETLREPSGFSETYENTHGESTTGTEYDR